MPVIAPLPGKGGAFKIGSTVYRFTRWSLKFTLATGKVMHFDSQTDGNSNYWPTVFANFAEGSGSAEGFVDHGSNEIPVAAGLYIGSTGTVSCLWSSTDGFTAPILVNGNDLGTDASSNDPGSRGLSFDLTGPPTRVFS